MKVLLLIVGGVVGALIAYAVITTQGTTPVITNNGATTPGGGTGPGPTQRSSCVTGNNRKTAVIEVFNDPDNAGRCKAKVSPGCIGNKKTMNVFWLTSYDEESQTCATGNWQVELRFDADPNGTPYNGEQNIKVNNNGNKTKYKLKNTDNAGKFPYKIWFIPASGSPYPMVDPELEIEM